MKKPLAILLAFFIVFAPVYSNAVLPALAASAASATRVLVGATIKKVSPAALANAKKAAIGICKSNPVSCGGLGVGGILGAIAGDGWNIEITNNDVNNIDVDIYKIPQNDACEVVFAYSDKKQASSIVTAAMVASRNASNQYGHAFRLSSNWQKEFDAFEAYWKLPQNKAQLTLDFKYMSDVSVKMDMKPQGGTFSKNESHWSQTTSGHVKCVPYPINKTYITNNELNQYVTNNTTNNDIDIKDIYNFDFSQYNINIGGDTYNGTTINNDLSKSDPSEADKKVSPDLKKKLDDGTISLDDVNDQNCTKNEAGEYDKCGDKTDPTDPEEPTDPEPEPEPPPIECDANGFYKKVCDWMDWTQKPHDKPDSGKVDIIDKSEGLNIDQNRIDFTNQCPAPTPINTSVGGFPVSTELNYQPLCDFFEMLNPFVIGMGGISSALIIAGGARRG